MFDFLTPTKTSPPVKKAAEKAPPGGSQALMGNAAVQEQLSDSDGAGSSHHLLYNTTTEGGQTRDPEQKDGALPWKTEGGWDANEILSNLTQVDNDAQTLNDGNRCAAVSTLAVHIQGGPASVIRVASSAFVGLKGRAVLSFLSSASDQVKQYYSDMSDALLGIIGRLSRGTATYQDLRRVSDAMKLVVDADPTSGTSAAEYPDLAGLGGGMQAYVGRTCSGLAEADQLASLVGITGNAWLPDMFAVLSVGTNDSQPDRTNHAVNLGVDGSGGVYLFDPWPKEGKQLMMWSSDQDLIKPYFENSAGTDRTWRVREIMRPA